MFIPKWTYKLRRREYLSSSTLCCVLLLLILVMRASYRCTCTPIYGPAFYYGVLTCMPLYIPKSRVSLVFICLLLFLDCALVWLVTACWSFFDSKLNTLTHLYYDISEREFFIYFLYVLLETKFFICCNYLSWKYMHIAVLFFLRELNFSLMVCWNVYASMRTKYLINFVCCLG